MSGTSLVEPRYLGVGLYSIRLPTLCVAPENRTAIVIGLLRISKTVPFVYPSFGSANHEMIDSNSIDQEILLHQVHDSFTFIQRLLAGSEIGIEVEAGVQWELMLTRAAAWNQHDSSMSRRSDAYLCADVGVGKEPNETIFTMDPGCEIDDQLPTP